MSCKFEAVFSAASSEEASSLASRILAARRDEAAEYGRVAGQVQRLMEQPSS
jgi:hypothetical protein